jgi:negative regulator of replication initiation
VHEAALVRQRHVAADEHVVGHRLAEDLDAEHVGDDLLRLALQVRVDEGDVVVGDDDVAERREALLDALYADLVRQAVAEVLQFLVRRCRRDEEAFAVTSAPVSSKHWVYTVNVDLTLLLTGR